MDWTTGDDLARLKWRMQYSHIPPEYQDADPARCRTPEHLQWFVQYLEGLMEEGKGAIIFGPVGTGKSSTAAIIAREALKLDKRVKWSYVPDLCDDMLDQYRRQQVKKLQMEPDLLVWDDFGVRPLSVFEIGILDQIVEGRYRRRKPMIITTNLTPEQLQDDAYARMRDRWRQRNKAWVLGGESQRKYE